MEEWIECRRSLTKLTSKAVVDFATAALSSILRIRAIGAGFSTQQHLH
jgi:hypothetical protein